MTDTIPPTPEVPPGLREAAQLTKLIPFVGAGASKLAGCPDWHECADEALRVFVEYGKFSEHHIQIDCSSLCGAPTNLAKVMVIVEIEMSVHLFADPPKGPAASWAAQSPESQPSAFELSDGRLDCGNGEILERCAASTTLAVRQI